MTAKVNDPSSAYRTMLSHWAVIDAVKGGTSEIRAHGEAYLPVEPFEKKEAYDRRKNRSTFSPWYTRLVRGLVGMVLRKPIALRDVSAAVATHLDNINLLGDDLNSFAREVFESAIDYGYTGIFVDYPRSEGMTTLAEQVTRGDRPYWIHYSAPEIIGWRYQVVGDRRVFTQLRILSSEMEPDGEFGEKEVERVRVYDLKGEGVRWRSYEKLKGRFELIEEGRLSLPVIPFAFLCTNKKKNLAVQPPMLEVAYLNIKHYQLSADLDHALHIAANPKLCLFGYDPDNGDVVTSVDEALIFENSEGKAEWIVPPPTSFDSLDKRIERIERQMAMLGLSSLVSQKNVGESAEAKKLDRTQGDSIMSVISQGLQDAFDLCLEYHATYLNEVAGTCEVNRDFNVAELSSQAIDTFSKLQSSGQITLETLLNLLKKGEVLGDEFDVEEEIAKLEDEFNRQSQPIRREPGELNEDEDDDEL